LAAHPPGGRVLPARRGLTGITIQDDWIEELEGRTYRRQTLSSEAFTRPGPRVAGQAVPSRSAKRPRRVRLRTSAREAPAEGSFARSRARPAHVSRSSRAPPAAPSNGRWPTTCGRRSSRAGAGLGSQQQHGQVRGRLRGHQPALLRGPEQGRAYPANHPVEPCGRPGEGPPRRRLRPGRAEPPLLEQGPRRKAARGRLTGWSRVPRNGRRPSRALNALETASRTGLPLLRKVVEHPSPSADLRLARDPLGHGPRVSKPPVGEQPPRRCPRSRAAGSAPS